MDCGASHNPNQRYPYWLRIRGNEYSFTPAQFSELCRHIDAIRRGAAESFSESYADLRTPKLDIGVEDLAVMLGLTKSKPRMRRI